MAEARILVENLIGRNGFDTPTNLVKDQCVEAVNVDFYGSPLGRKRGGSSSLSLTSAGTAFSGAINAMFRHVPTADDTAAELWAIDSAASPVVHRLAGGTRWNDVTLDDAITSRPQDVNASTFNGKLFLCYGNGSNASTDTTNAATSGTNYIVGAGVTQLTVKAWGAAGGADGGDGGTAGGGGGFASAIIPVTPGETLSKKVGGGGARSGSSFQGGGGGGYTGLFRGTTPLLIAGGGGGGAKDGAGGAGGGSTGSAGSGNGGGAGTQSIPGAGGGYGVGSGLTLTLAIDYLLVGPGGGGGASDGGGGGGGQVVSGSESIAVGASYAVVIGTGGAGGSAPNNPGSDGSAASTFNSHSAAIGKGGGGNVGAGGNSGGAGLSGAAGGSNGGGGGGGTVGNGTVGSEGVGGNGGAGLTSDISGTAVSYGGGAGGGTGSGGTAGTGFDGGGNGGVGSGAGSAGTTNRGGGGGGGGGSAAGGNGADGVVIIRYLTSTLAQATGGTITTSGLYTIHTFTSGGNFIIATSAVGGDPNTSSFVGSGGAGGGWLSGGSAGATGGTNGGGSGGAHGSAGAFRSGGGGGGGWFGGGGGSADRNDASTGGGGGGSSYVSGTNTFTVAGSGLTPANTGDADYGSNAGLGKTNAAGNDGLLVIHATTAVDRLHVYDPNLASPRVRRVGLATTGAPTVANTGGGAYPATLRYYRQRTIQLDSLTSTKVIRRSEPSASVSFTPSGGGTAARVTRATFPGEGETHWEVEASTDNITFYRLAQIAIGTTTYDDSALIATYSSNPVSDPIGMYALPTAVKGIIATGSRLLMAGAYATGGKNNRVWWTPVLGSSDQGDDERIPTTLASYTDLSENAGDTFVGFGGPIFNGVIFVFMQREIWRLTPTGDVTSPYISRQMSDTVGAINQKCICLGEDESGQPAIYFTSYLGFYRIGRYGLQYIGRDVEDRWFGLYGQTAANLTASNQICHSVWHAAKHQVWFWQATDSNSDPEIKFVFDPKLGRAVSQGEVRGGWTIHDSIIARCSVMFSNTVGATMSRDLKPYVALTAGPSVLKCDTLDLNDNGLPFMSYIITGPLTPPAGVKGTFGVREPVLQAATQSGVTIQLTLIRDYGVESDFSTVTLTPIGGESRVTPKFSSAKMSRATVIQARLGDVSAASAAWSLDALTLPLEPMGMP